MMKTVGKILAFVVAAFFTCLIIMNFVMGWFWHNGFYYTYRILAILATASIILWVLQKFIFKEEDEETTELVETTAEKILSYLTATLFTCLIAMNFVMGWFWPNGFDYTYWILAILATASIILWLINVFFTKGNKVTVTNETPKERYNPRKTHMTRQKKVNFEKCTDEDLEDLMAEARRKGDHDLEEKIEVEYSRRLEIATEVKRDFERKKEQHEAEVAQFDALMKKYSPVAKKETVSEEPNDFSDRLASIVASNMDTEESEQEESESLVLPAAEEKNAEEDEKDEEDEYSKRLSALFTKADEEDDYAEEE